MMGFIIKTTGFIMKTTGLIIKTTGFIIKTTGFELKTTGFIIKTAGFILTARVGAFIIRGAVGYPMVTDHSVTDVQHCEYTCNLTEMTPEIML